MRSILVSSARKDAYRTISSCLRKGHRIESASTKDIALNLLQKNLYDLIFIDLDILLKNISNENYREALQQFWNQYPSIEINGIHPNVIDAFKTYDWPGNIRELENLIERAYILESSSILTQESFPNDLFDSETTRVFIPTSNSMTLSEVRQHGIEEIERNYLKEVLTRNKGKISESARDAGISTRQLNKLMNKYGLKKEKFKSS